MGYEAEREGESKRSWWERMVEGYAQQTLYKCIEFSKNRKYYLKK